MAIDRSVMGRISKKWFEAERAARPNADRLVLVTKRPTLISDQELICSLFGKTRCRTNLAALVEEKDLARFHCVRLFCTTYSL